MLRYLLCSALVLFSFFASAGTMEDDIREAVFRHQMGKVKADTYFLSFGNNKHGEFISPPNTFMQRFDGDPIVKPFSGMFLTRENTVLLSIDSVSQSRNNAEAAVRFVFSDFTRSSAGFYKLSQTKDGAWKVVRIQRMKIIPLD